MKKTFHIFSQYVLLSCVLMTAVLLNSSEAYAKTEKAFKSLQDIPDFINVADMVSKQRFMTKLYAQLNERLLPTPKVITFLDDNDNVTRKTLENYREMAAAHVVHLQTKKFTQMDQDQDGTVSLSEMSEAIDVSIEDMHELYKIGVVFRDTANDQLAPLYQKIDKYNDGWRSAEMIYKQDILPFMDIDANKDKVLSQEELRTPEERVYKDLTKNTVKMFESLLALSKDKQSVSVNTISEVALMAYNTVDQNSNNKISRWERYEYYRLVSAPRARERCLLPSLKDTVGPIYAISTERSHALASVDFHIRFIKSHTYYTEVHLEKQTVPVTLILESAEPMIWNFTGDVDNIETAIILGPGPKTFHEEYKYDEVYSGVTGIPKEKAHFGRGVCWNNSISYGVKNSPNKLAAIFKKARTDIENKFQKKPYLVEFQRETTHIRVHSSPKIQFDTQVPDTLVSQPQGYNEVFWKNFLLWMPSGYKAVDFDQLFAGAYATPKKIMPAWAGLAQLEHFGFIQVMDVEISPSSKRVVALLKRDLPSFFGSAINQTISLIKAHDKISTPANPEQTASARGFCIRNSSGKPLFGNDYVCRPADMKYVEQIQDMDLPEPDTAQREKPSDRRSYDPVFLTVKPFIPSMVAYKDPLEVNLDIDEDRCREAYKDLYLEKCKIAHELLNRELPAYAVTSDPTAKYTVSWKAPSTIVLTPAEDGFWDPSNVVTLTINLDELGLPENYQINGKREASARFQPHYIEFQISNVVIAPRDNQNRSFKLTADVTSNYPLEDITGTANHIAEGSLLPDEHLETHEDFKSAISILHPPNDDLPLIMDGLKGQLSRTIYNNEFNLPYTHLNFYDVRSAVGMNGMFSPPLWVTLPAFKQKSLPEKYESVLARAKSGEAQAQYEIARLYHTGDGIPKSLTKARKWYRKAAKQGRLDAQIALGQFNMVKYPYGRNYETQPEAYYWLSLAAEKNNKVAQYELGVLFDTYFHNGYGGFKDEARQMYEESAAQGYEPALLALGQIYENGDGVDVDYNQARHYYTRAQQEGNHLAQAYLAKMQYLGLGVEPSAQNAYDMARDVLKKVERHELAVRDVAARLIADILLDVYPLSSKTAQKIKDPIADKIFSDFERPFVRMWIASQFPVVRGSIHQDIQNADGPIAKELVIRQLNETPDLPELRFVKAKLVLSDGYLAQSHYLQRGYNYYDEGIIPNVLEMLDPLLQDPVLVKEVTPVIVSVHLSNNDPKSAFDLLQHLMFEKYFTSEDVAMALGYYYEYTGRSAQANTYYRLARSWVDVYRVGINKHGDIEKYEKYLLSAIDKNPGESWRYEEYARFLISVKGDYSKALQFAVKAFELQNSSSTRRLIGSAYAIKAAQLYKEHGVITQKVKDYMELAAKYACTRWGMMLECGRYCGDIIDLSTAFYRAAKTELKNIQKH